MNNVATPFSIAAVTEKRLVPSPGTAMTRKEMSRSFPLSSVTATQIVPVATPCRRFWPAATIVCGTVSYTHLTLPTILLV